MSATTSRTIETKLNIILGQLLSKELGLKAVSEQISRGGRPDVIIYINGVKVVLEGSYSRKDAEKDVERRIRDGVGDIGVALFYKESFSTNLTDSELEKKFRASTFEVRLIIPEDISESIVAYFTNQKIEPRWVTEWIEAQVEDLDTIISEAIQFIVREEDVRQMIGEIEQQINDFVSSAKSIDSTKQLARNLYDIFYKLYGLSVGNYEEIDELLYAQAGLAILLSTIFYQSVCTQIGLNDITGICKSNGYRLGLRKAFEEILKIDYRPIYTTAIDVVQQLPDDIGMALEKVVELAERCSSKRTLLKKDFSGKIYHRIVGDWAIRKNFATYFTTVPAAYLLAYLAVYTETGVFRKFNSDIKVGDLACGSGTLVIASYGALKDRYISSRFKHGEVDLKAFHKQMLEKALWGIDTLRYAVQIASTNLALQDPITQVTHMNTFILPLGVEDGSVTLGSLEFIKGRGFPSITMYFTEKHSTKLMEAVESASITGGEIPPELPELDFIIMNPPFTRATGRGGKEKGGLFGFVLDDAVRDKITKKYGEFRSIIRTYLEAIAQQCLGKRTFEKLGVKDELFSIGQAGEGLLFLYLASKRIKDGGKIAFVLPKSLLTGVSWFTARSLLFNKFHLEHMVVSYDASNGYNFSESTSLSETLIVARKRREGEIPKNNEKTTVTILLNKPSTSLEARALALGILKTKDEEYLEIDGSKEYVYKVPRKKLKERLTNWGSFLAFPDPKLTKICDEILLGKLFTKKISMKKLGEIANIGIDRHQFRDAFKVVKGRPPNSYPVVYGGEEERRLYMLTEPNDRMIAKNVITKNGEILGNALFRRFSSNLLIPDRIWVDTAHVIGVYCKEPVLSNIFYAVRLKSDKNDEKRLKALCVWLNTSWGILSVLANRSETRGRWISLKMTHWKLQPVLNVTRLKENEIDGLASVFDKYCMMNLRRLPQQFDPINVDPVRREIDREFLRALDVEFKEEEINKIYRLIHENLRAWIEISEQVKSDSAKDTQLDRFDE